MLVVRNLSRTPLRNDTERENPVRALPMGTPQPNLPQTEFHLSIKQLTTIQ